VSTFGFFVSSRGHFVFIMNFIIPELELSASGLPKESGVYAVILFNRNDNNELINTHILYIGSSANLRSRVYKSSHPYMMLFNRGLNVCVAFDVCDNFIELEKHLIHKYKPMLNKTYKR